MKEAEIQFASERKIIVKDIIDYVESQDFDVIVTKDEEHITVFRNSVEYMIVKDTEDISDPDETTRKCNTCAYKDRDYSYCMEIRKCNQYSGYEKEEK